MITVFGSINLDLVVAVPRLPTAGETVTGPDHQSFAGGKGANQALSACRAGSDVRMVGAVGKDAFADLALANMKSEGVDLSGVRSLDGATGLAFIGIDRQGENQIIVASGANARVEADWLSPSLSQGDMLMLQGETPFGEAEKAIAMAGKSGAKVFWNPAPVPMEDIKALIETTATLVVNETEAAEVAERLGIAPEPQQFVEALAAPERTVVVTLGGDGVVAGKGETRLRLPSPAIKVVDTTGAGDAFCGALACALDQGRPFERAIREGVAAGALACTVTGAQSSAPAKDDIARLADQIV
ncbi:ribokinase [Rhodobacterales bacterium]|nr:ribokinase [Rhodobacterales bacterium]